MIDPDDADESAVNRRRASRRAVGIGSIIVLSALILLVLLAFVGGVGGELTKYAVTVIFLVGCLGAALLINGAIDWWRTR